MKLLTYTPHKERTRAPANDELDPRTQWNRPFVLRAFCWHGDVMFEPTPCISVNTVPTDAFWRGRDFEPYEAGIWFNSRQGFRNAWRLARALRRFNGHILVTKDAVKGTFTELGSRHSVFEKEAA